MEPEASDQQERERSWPSASEPRPIACPCSSHPVGREARHFQWLIEGLAGGLVLDIGGEGRYRRAWNLNPRTRRTIGPLRGQRIPRLIQGRGECVPLPADSVDLVIVERTPLRAATIDEIRRVTKPGGWVLLRHALAPTAHPHLPARRLLDGTAYTTAARIGRQSVTQTIFRIADA